MQVRGGQRAAFSIMATALTGAIAFGAKPPLIPTHDPALIRWITGGRTVPGLSQRGIQAVGQSEDGEYYVFHLSWHRALRWATVPAKPDRAYPRKRGWICQNDGRPSDHVVRHRTV